MKNRAIFCQISYIWCKLALDHEHARHNGNPPLIEDFQKSPFWRGWNINKSQGGISLSRGDKIFEGGGVEEIR